MYLVVNAKGLLWDGFAWGQKGKPFLTFAAATRSLYEEGEGLEQAAIMPKEKVTL